MKPIAIIAIIAAVVVVGGACAGVAFSGVLNGSTTGPGGDNPVVPTDPVEPTPTETPTETPTPTPADSSMSYFSPMTSSGSSSSSKPVHDHTYSAEWTNDTTTHWHASTCGHDVIKDEAAHVYEDCTMDSICNICGYEKSSSAHDLEMVGDDETQWKCKYCSYAVTYAAKIGGDYFLTIPDAINAAEDNAVITIIAGTYEGDATTDILVNKSVTIKGVGTLKPELRNVVFGVEASSLSHPMDVTFDNLKFTGNSRIKLEINEMHNGVGGPDAVPLSNFTITNCYAETTMSSDSLDGGKGQFIYLKPTYNSKWNLTITGNTLINAHTISGEDAAPVISGNGGIIKNVVITGNTFGSEENQCDRYAVKFARRDNGTTIDIQNNIVYGATTAEKDFYILDLWQSGSNVQNDLTVTINGNDIRCTPDTGKSVYTAYIEASVKGSNINVVSSGTVLNNSVDTSKSNENA